MLEDDDDKDMPTKTLAFRHNLLEDYLTMLLLAFNEAQLLEVITPFPFPFPSRQCD